MIHHAVLGSLERWLSIVMENQGELPAWLSPHQVALLPIGSGQEEACHELARELREAGVAARVLDDGPLSGRVRDAEELHYAHIAIVGKREQAQHQVSARGVDGQSRCMDRNDWRDCVVAHCRAPRLGMDPGNPASAMEG